MKPRSNLTLKNPPETNENRKKFSKFVLLDSVSPDIRRSVDKCMTDLNIGYRSTLQGGGLKTIWIHPRKKEKSINNMSVRRKQERTDYLDSKRHSNGLPYTNDVTTSSSSTVEMEVQAFGGASSLASLHRLVTQRKEYLEMSQNRKKKVQWYARVTRQSKQLLNFLRANDRSAGDTFDNYAAKLVLAHTPVPVESRQEIQPATSRVTSARPEPPSFVTAKKDLKRKRNESVELSCDNKRNSYARRTNGNTKAQKLSGRLAKSDCQDGVVRMENNNQSQISSTARVMTRIQDVRLALTADISGSSLADNETGTAKRKMTYGDDKENEELGEPSRVHSESSRLRATAGVPNGGVRRDVPHFNRAPGTPRQNYDQSNNNNNNAINNVGALRNGENGSSQIRKIPGSQPSSQTWSAAKRKRVNFNGTFGNNTKSEEGRCTRTDWMAGAETSGSEAMGSLKEAMGRSTTKEAMGRPDESLWMTLKNMWKKQDKSGGGAEEMEWETPTAPSLEADLTKGGTTTGPCKMPPRGRVGRSIKRRRRDVKPATVWTKDDDVDDAVGPQDLPTCGSRTGRPFVIPDRPYDVDEALSMDLLNAAYDFIHNG